MERQPSKLLAACTTDLMDKEEVAPPLNVDVNISPPSSISSGSRLEQNGSSAIQAGYSRRRVSAVDQHRSSKPLEACGHRIGQEDPGWASASGTAVRQLQAPSSRKRLLDGAQKVIFHQSVSIISGWT